MLLLLAMPSRSSVLPGRLSTNKEEALSARRCWDCTTTLEAQEWYNPPCWKKSRHSKQLLQNEAGKLVTNDREKMEYSISPFFQSSQVRSAYIYAKKQWRTCSEPLIEEGQVRDHLYRYNNVYRHVLLGPYSMHPRAIIGLYDVTAKTLHHFWKVMEIRENSRWEEEGLENIIAIYLKGQKEDSGNYRLVDKLTS